MARWLSWLERRPVTAEVVGSNPIRVAFLIYYYLGILAQLGEHLPYKQRVTGSSPVGPTFLDFIIEYADVAQLAEQLICNQQVIGSSPIVGFMDGFPSGQRGQTVNLLQIASVVRIHHHPFKLISRGGAARKLAGLITRRSQVQILSPQLKCPDSSVGRAED